MRLVLANQATAAKRRVYLHLVDATDGMTPETGEAGGQPQISTNGGAWTNTGIGTLTAIGNGRYYADLTQAAVANAGDVIETRYKSANTAECPGDSVQVVAFDPDDAVDLGLSNLDAAVSSRLAPTVASRTLDVSAGGEAGVDWANVGSPTTTVTLSGTTVKTATDVETDTQDIQSRLPAALVSGRMDSSVGAMAANVMTAAAAAADFGTEIAAAVWDRLTSALTTVGSIGKLIVDYLDAAISSRAASGASVTIASPVIDDETIEIYPGDAYTTTHNRPFDFALTGAPDLTNATVTLAIELGRTDVLTVTGSVLNAGSATQTARFQPTAANTALLTRYGTGAYTFQVQASWSGDTPAQPATIVRGSVNTIRKYTV